MSLSSNPLLALFTGTWLGLAAVPAGAAGPPPEQRSSATDQVHLGVTVYNDDLAMVRDRRQVDLARAQVSLAFTDVSARIQPETARLYGATVLEQNFDYDLLSPAKLLEKYVGREIGLVRTHPTTGEEYQERGTLLSVAEGGVVFRIDERIETGGTTSPWRFVFDEVPDNLRERPTLSMLLDAEPGPRELELVYLTGGLSWQADYVASLEADGSLDLTGWVTLNNTSGTSYRQAELQLLAGDVNRVRPPPQRQMRDMVMAAPAAAPQREALFEYHLYTLPRPTTILNRQTKQVRLLGHQGIPAQRRYVIDAGTNFRAPRGSGPDLVDELSAQVMIAFDNDKPSLGVPLPAGTLRFYQRDGDGDAQFIGEDRIDHTPEGRRVELELGRAFDVTATRRQTDFEKRFGNTYESAWEVVVMNAKDQSVEVEVLARPGGDWEVLESSHDHDRPNAATARWRLPVPAKGETTLTWQVRVR